jgi:alkylhydroperoxidase family enzyme
MFVTDPFSATRSSVTAHCLQCTSHHITIPCHFDDVQENVMFCSAAVASRTLKLTTEEIADISC